MTKDEQIICSICQTQIPSLGTWLFGCNAAPVNNGRCCYECNENVVVPARMKLFKRYDEESRNEQRTRSI
jgi:uncharacterized membrane protein